MFVGIGVNVGGVVGVAVFCGVVGVLPGGLVGVLPGGLVGVFPGGLVGVLPGGLVGVFPGGLVGVVPPPQSVAALPILPTR